MSLADLLADPHISVPELFQHPDILNQIKYKIGTFVDFCKQNEEFTNIMITLGIKTPMHKHENIQMRRVSHVASDFLTCDNDTIADLFVIEEMPARIRCYSQDDDEILQEIVSNETTGELTIANRTPSKQKNETSEFNKKYIYLLDLLDYLNQVSPDENCINYMIKVFNTVVRVKPDQRPQIMRRMIQLTNFPSISYSIAKIINEGEDKKYRDFKVDVVHMLIKQILGKLDCPNFHVYAQFVQEVFDKNRHRGEQQDELKIATQPLVDKEVINTLLASILSQTSNPQRIGNCLLFLLKVVERMNIDEEQDPYSYNEPQSNKPTMDFQTQQLFNSYDRLLSLAPAIGREKYVKYPIMQTSAQILTYYQVLLGMAKNSRFKQMEIDKAKHIIALLKVLSQGQNNFNGIIKNKIVNLIELIFNKVQDQKGQEDSRVKQEQEIKDTIENLGDNKKQALCYKQKLHLLFGTGIDHCAINQVHTKYSSVLAPTNYTQNRNYKVKQLQFVRQHAARTKNAQNGSIPASKIDTQDSSPYQNGAEELVEHVINEEPPVVNSNSPINGIGINLNMLNNKINAIKSKKQSKQEQIVPKEPATQEADKMQKLEKVSEGGKQKEQGKSKMQQKQQHKQNNGPTNGDGQSGVKKQRVEEYAGYYVKHLMLF